jgi:hypothetical protein
MTENESSVEPSRFATANLIALVSKEELASKTVRDGCFVIEKSPDPIDQLDHAPAMQTLDRLKVDSNNETEGELLERLGRKALPSITRISTKSPAQDSFVLMQKWEGVVTKIIDEFFTATLKDLSAEGEDEEAEIPIEEISPADIKLLAPGAVFYWCIGYRDTLIGQRIRASEIRFRRLPTWSVRELQNARKEAEEISELLDWK